ncbi:hypothetical protein F3Y22_tig00000132pilonHSYRG00206 [Hibiscus syriacus]|uniref:aminomethyltransferase n=1 Tax=Hibiscus syriacus TaxID=106335 RepID=A0A6A3DAA6_HIBSY|nr:hypothetical protein F3Y22_tig00000132pilonHSYRG00206 [Hibiscus syriacus]
MTEQVTIKRLRYFLFLKDYSSSDISTLEDEGKSLASWAIDYTLSCSIWQEDGPICWMEHVDSVQLYKDSIMYSTVNCRQNGGLFNISHMYGLSLKGKDCVPFLEKLIIVDVAGLAPGMGTLTVFTNEKGGAIDDYVITKVKDDHIYLVANAGCRYKDLAHIEEHMKASSPKVAMSLGTSMMRDLF